MSATSQQRMTTLESALKERRKERIHGGLFLSFREERGEEN